MQTKHYKVHPAEMAQLPAKTIEFSLDFDEMSFIWGYSEELFVTVCACDPYLASLFAIKLNEMAEAIDYRIDQDFHRPGSYAVHDDKSWLIRPVAIATKAALRVTGSAPMSQTVAKDIMRETATYSEPAAPPVIAEVLDTSEEATTQPDLAKRGDLYLPTLNIGQFMLPTVFARCGIFGADGPRRGKRFVWSSNAPRIISHFSGVQAGRTTIAYTGEDLWTSDEEVWMALLAAAVAVPMGEEVNMRILDLMHAMPGRGVDGTHPRQRVRKAGARLKAASLVITTNEPAAIELIKKSLPNNPAVRDAKKKNFLELTVSLLEAFATSSDTITFRIGRELAGVFGDKLYTWYDSDAYYSLPVIGLSRRLFLLYNSHVDCHPLTQAELVEFLGVKSKTARHVRAVLENAHAELLRQGLILAHEFRKPTDAERKNCSAACFVVARPNRPARLAVAVAVAE